MRRTIILLAVIVIGGLAYTIWPAKVQNSQNSADAPVAGGAIANVILPDTLTQNAQIGKRAFEISCASCHGVNAAGQGGIAPPLVHIIYETSQHLTLTMMGGAMGGRHDGDNIWAFNNVSDLQEEPFRTFQRGETGRITMINDTSFPHGIHLHGHHFYEVGEGDALGDLRDTTLVDAGTSRDIICVFDNPGRWLLHCHMLSHAVGGMRTWVNVA